MHPISDERQRGWALIGLVATTFTVLLAASVGDWPLTVAWGLLAVSFILVLAVPSHRHLLYWRIAFAGVAFGIVMIHIVLQWGTW